MTDRLDFFLKALAKASFYSGALILATIVSQEILHPVQGMIHGRYFPDHDQPHFTLLYFPFGVRIIAAFVEGWKSVLYVLPGCLLLRINGYDMGIDSQQIELQALCIVVPPLVFSILDWENRVCRTISDPHQAWRTLFLGGFFAAVLNIHVFHLARTDHRDGLMTLEEDLMFTFGGMLGLFLLLYLSLFVLRWLNVKP